MAKQKRIAWPESPPPLPEGLTREIFVTLPLGFALNREVMDAGLSAGDLSQEDAQRLIQEDEYRKAINAILGYFSYWELRNWRKQVEQTGRWSAPPSLIGMRRKAVWKALYGHLQSANGEAAKVAR